MGAKILKIIVICVALVVVAPPLLGVLLVVLMMLVGVGVEYGLLTALFIVSLFVAAVMSFYAYTLYVRLVRDKNAAEKSLKAIDTQLRKRFDTIPNLLKIAKKYMEGEISAIIDVTKIRQGNLSNANSNVEQLKEALKETAETDKAIRGLRVAFEQYPELQSDELYLNAMTTLTRVEEDISSARRMLNRSVERVNVRIETFPSSIIAKKMGMEKYPYYVDDAQDQIKASIDVSDYM
jgi:LemA protein